MDDKLTAKQKKFADAYIMTGNITDSARQAGYKNPGVQGCQNLKKDNVQEYIKQQTKQAEKETIANLIEVKEFWTEVMRNKDADLKDRLKATELLGKSAGAFLDKLQVDATVDVVNIEISGDEDAD